MKHHFQKIAVAVALTLLAAACGGKQTMASKSATAFREAQQKGTPVTGGGHGGHEAGEQNATMTGMDHSTMTGGAMAGMDHSTMNMEGQGAMAGMDHANMPDMQPGQPMAGMDHSKMNMQPGQPMAGMDHSKMDMQPGQPMAGMDHSKMNMQPGQPMAGMDHSKMDMKPGQPMAGMDHSKMDMKPGQPMAGMDHSKMDMKPGQPMAGMDHSKMDMKPGQLMTGMDHSNMPGMQHGAATAPVVIPPPTSNAEIQRIRPAATLKNDAFDAPAQTALAETAKAIQGSGDQGLARGITPGEDRENPPTPAPAIRDIPAQGNTSVPAMDHSQHGGQSMPVAPPSAMDHSQHGGQSAPPAKSRTQPRTAPPSAAQPAAATIYTCPMHPEVTSDKPGTCPKCGMTLVKKQ